MIDRRLTTGAQLPGRQGNVRTVVLLVVSFCLGLFLSVAWFHRQPAPVPVSQPQIELSQSTKAILSLLDKPVEMRFYSLLDPNSPATLRDFATRVEQLLTAYQQASADKVVLVAQTNSDANTALADGIKGFNLDKGEGCYLGLSLSCAGKKEVLAQLVPDWESALEADVSRAIQRLGPKASSAAAPAGTAPADSALAEELQRKIPNLPSVSLEDGLRTLREESVKEFTAAVNEMHTQVQDAQARLVQAKTSGSAEEQETAMKQLQSIQTSHAQRLRELAANSQALIEALKKLKAGGN
jgi:hypothetical protein